MNRFLMTIEEGARTQIYLATSDEVVNITGKYFKNCKIIETKKITYNKTLQKSIWDLSEKMIENALKNS